VGSDGNQVVAVCIWPDGRVVPVAKFISSPLGRNRFIFIDDDDVIDVFPVDENKDETYSHITFEMAEESVAYFQQVQQMTDVQATKYHRSYKKNHTKPKGRSKKKVPTRPRVVDVAGVIFPVNDMWAEVSKYLVKKSIPKSICAMSNTYPYSITMALPVPTYPRNAGSIGCYSQHFIRKGWTNGRSVAINHGKLTDAAIEAGLLAMYYQPSPTLFLEFRVKNKELCKLYHKMVPTEFSPRPSVAPKPTNPKRCYDSFDEESEGDGSCDDDGSLDLVIGLDDHFTDEAQKEQVAVIDFSQSSEESWSPTVTSNILSGFISSSFSLSSGSTNDTVIGRPPKKIQRIDCSIFLDDALDNDEECPLSLSSHRYVPCRGGGSDVPKRLTVTNDAFHFRFSDLCNYVVAGRIPPSPRKGEKLELKYMVDVVEVDRPSYRQPVFYADIVIKATGTRHELSRKEKGESNVAPAAHRLPIGQIGFVGDRFCYSKQKYATDAAEFSMFALAPTVEFRKNRLAWLVQQEKKPRLRNSFHRYYYVHGTRKTLEQELVPVFSTSCAKGHLWGHSKISVSVHHHPTAGQRFVLFVLDA
jgi:hypothetical protein